MKRIQYHRYGGPEELRLEEVGTPEPRHDQIRVRVIAAAANPMDWGIRQGAIKILTGRQFPRGLGHDFAGIVEAIGPDVGELKVGDEVFGATGLKEAGAFGEVLLAQEKHVVRKPPSLSFEQAAALTLVSVTAWTGLIDRAKLRAGQSVFVVGCLGGVGRAATQLALMYGARVAGSCSGADHQEALQLGVSEVADYRNFDPADFAGQFDVVLNIPGTLTMRQSAMMLKRGGVVVHFDGRPLTMLRTLFSRQHVAIIADPKPATMAGIAAAAQGGKLVPKIGRCVPLAEGIAALNELETTGLPKGKLILVP